MKIKKLFKKKSVLLLLSLSLFLAIVMIYQTYKPLPQGVSYGGKVYQVEDVDFLTDLTYKDKYGAQVYEQSIFKEINQTIKKAEQFIVVDMFLYNSYVDENIDYPNISQSLTNTLINQKEKKPKLKIIVVSDSVNTTYGSHEAKQLEQLKKHGIDVVITKLNPLRDPNPIYSSVWRTFIQWFGQEGTGWVPNPMAETAPKVTMRSYLKLMNIKANHRKLIATENAAIVSSANPHDASGFHSNIAFKVKGGIIADIIEAEQAVSDFSEGPKMPKYDQKTKGSGPIQIQYLTEGKIYRHIIKALDDAADGDRVWIGMFYLADREVIDAIVDAAERNVKVNLVLDPNQNAFGAEKIGLPNLPVASELRNMEKKNIKIRWYNTDKEQYHSKILYVDHGDHAVILGGSANFTKRNLANYNLENNLKIVAPSDEEITREVDDYFNRIWNNEKGTYTVEYEKYQDKLPVFKYIMYVLQKIFQFTTY
ncbi:phospholipase D family protein [Metabacillus arenae]|uniref:phospholipase D n=1 Tax=Metabacillus arenae TaxID=2771434 RepID=A0A926NFS3_9BACI|nr:phospholipase D family protein [Metabacillus arenae]MBD1380305.1 phospholipase D family protein [Metabacillus arenae]